MSPARQPVRAVLFGIGPIGAGIGRLAAQRDEIELAGAIVRVSAGVDARQLRAVLQALRA